MAVVAAAGAACLFPDPPPLADGGAGPDAGGDAAQADAGDAGDSGVACDPAKPFTSIAPIAELDDGDDQYKASLTPDELEIWYGFTQKQSDGGKTIRIMHASRASRNAPFGTPSVEANLAPGDVDPAVTDDGLTIYYSKFGTVGNWDLFTATRPDRASAFGIGSQLPAAIQSTSADTAPFVAFDGSLYFTSERTGSDDIWRAAAAGGGFASPALVASLSSTARDSGIVITRDGLWAYVTSDRTDLGSSGGEDVFLAHRALVTGDFGAPTNVSEINGASAERANWISWDGCRLYFESTRNSTDGTSDLFIATKLP